ncbi:MAG: hypothetical protein ACOCV2_10830, partial [Persicimonas sp.]
NVPYSLSAEGLEGVDLAVENMSDIVGTYGPDDQFWLSFDISNNLSETATAPDYEIWLSDSQTLDEDDATSLYSSTLSSDVSGNSSESVTEQIQLPSSDLWDGTGYIHVVVETDDSQDDANEANNSAREDIDLEAN